MLTVCAYIDLNPVAAGIVEVPEASPHTSIGVRLEHAKAEGRLPDLEAAKAGSVAGSLASAGLEESIWLCPIEDRRRFDSSREGMFEGFSLGSYLQLVDYTGRILRVGKAAISAELAGIFDRIGTDAASWGDRLKKRQKAGLSAASSPPLATACVKRRAGLAWARGQPFGVHGSITSTKLIRCRRRSPESPQNRFMFRRHPAPAFLHFFRHATLSRRRPRRQGTSAPAWR